MLGLAADESFFLTLVIYLVPMILSLSVHEFAHALAAYRLGDDTAAREGRLTLSPLAHIDIFGTILVPTFSVLVAGFAFIGWARPVPVRPERFKRSVTMRSGMMLTAVAGPLSNLMLALLAIGAFSVLVRWAPHLMSGDDGRASGVAMLLGAMFQINIGLFIFNLLPLPPLDGSRLLPRSMGGLVASVSPYSFVILLVILNFEQLRGPLLDTPMMLTVSFVQEVFQTAIIGGLL